MNSFSTDILNQKSQIYYIRTNTTTNNVKSSCQDNTKLISLNQEMQHNNLHWFYNLHVDNAYSSTNMC